MKMKKTQEFLSYLCSQDIKLWMENDRLRCSAPKAVLTPDIKAELAARKAEILAYLTQANQILKSNSESIQPVPRERNIPLSFAQQRLWFFNQLEPNSSVYNMPAAVKLTGKLKIDILSQSFNEIIRRHEILRTRFTVVDGEPIQVVEKGERFTFTVIDLPGIAEDNKQQEVLKLAAIEAQKPFDLLQDCLIRASLIQLSPRENVVLLTMHHIVSDGWSMGILIRELITLYTAFSLGQISPLPELPIQYADFAIWQRKWLQGEVLQTQLNYWKQQLNGSLPILELPTDKPRPAIQSSNGATQQFQLSKSLAEKLNNLSKQEGVTLFMTLLAAFKVLLYRYTQQEDMIVGTPIANRNRTEIEGLIGFFVNTLVLRTSLSNHPTFRELLQQVREVTLGAYAHQDLPFERLVEELQPERNLSHNPLFQVMFILQNASTEVLHLPELTLEQLRAEKNTANFDLTLSLTETEAGLKGDLEYNTDIFDAARINRMLRHFQVLLEGIVTNPEQRLSKLPLLTANEQHQLLVEWNNNQIDYPQHLCIHQLFEAQVEKTPDAVAVVFESVYLTYQEINQRANQLAHYLQKSGVKSEVLVGICVERSIEMIVGILGILKAGGVYIPLDPAYPQERLVYMLEDAQVPIIITQKEILKKSLIPNTQIIDIDSEWEKIAQNNIKNININLAKNNLAYVIYTSGSTGKSKGVMIEHRSLVNAYFAWEETYQLKKITSHLQMASFSFDVFSGDLVRALCSGGKLVLCPREFLLEPEKLYQLMLAQKVDCAEFVPGVLRNLVQYLEQSQQSLDFMQLLVCASDSWYIQEYEKFHRICGSQTRLINSFGLTEATIDSTYFETKTINSSVDKLVPIGKPFANTQIYILDQYQQLLPVGLIGEIYIGGASLARGYQNRSDLTASKFIPNHFSDQTGGFLYQTGDLGTWLPDGNIELIGRIDNQVKLRGFRIELGEIEAIISQYPVVRETVVVVRKDSVDSQQIVAYVVPQKQQTLTIDELRNFLESKLPKYMVPAAFVILKALPLTPNGKVDRKALPIPELGQVSSSNIVPASTPIENLLAGIWREVLGIEKVGIENNFFELGGHSLLATRVISQVRRVFQVELPLRYLFEKPTIAGLAKEIDNVIKADLKIQLPTIKRASRLGNIPLSYAQQRLWYLDQLQANNSAYNIFEALHLTGSLNISALEQSLNEVIRRHENLRTNFIVENGQPVQVIHPSVNLNLPIVNLTSLSEAEREETVQKLINQEAQKPFQLNTSQLLRVTLVHLAETEYILLVTMHHIISDAWSIDILIQELISLYKTFSESKKPLLPELSIQYADFAIWQKQWLQGEVLERLTSYWKKQLQNLPTLKLTTDYSRPVTPTYQGSIQFSILSPTVSQAIKSLSNQQGVTLFMTLQTAFVTLMHYYTKQDDIVIGTDVANRNQGETEGLIGFFVNQLVLRTSITNNPTFSDLLQKVRDTTLDAYSHQDLPFDILVNILNPERHLNRSPLFQVKCIFNNTQTPQLEIPNLTIDSIPISQNTTQIDLMMILGESQQSIVTKLEYSTDIFAPETIAQMLKSWEIILKQIVANPHIKLQELINVIAASMEAEKQLQKTEHKQNIQQKLKKIKRKAIKDVSP